MGWSSVSLLSVARLSVWIVCLLCPFPVHMFLSMSAYALTICPYDSSPCMSLTMSPCPSILLIMHSTYSPQKCLSSPTYISPCLHTISPCHLHMSPHPFLVTYFHPSLCLPMPLPISSLSPSSVIIPIPNSSCPLPFFNF